MPIRIDNDLPAKAALEEENVFVMDKERACTQDIRPLKIAILNLMPNKLDTELHLLRSLSNTPLQVDITLFQTKSYTGNHTPLEHLEKFYRYIDDVKNEKFDGLIITGAPVEKMNFEEVDYWDELKEIMDWSKTHVYSTVHICWGAQAALYHHYNIPKYKLDKKLFGVFKHKNNILHDNLTRGLNDIFYAPHSRHTEIKKADIEKVDDLEILSESDEAGVFIVANKNRRQIFITGHLEYDRDTLKEEYREDTPVAVVYKASWEDQKIVIGNLTNIAQKVKEAGITKTALTVVGDFLGDEYELSKLYDKTFTHEFRQAKE